MYSWVLLDACGAQVEKGGYSTIQSAVAGAVQYGRDFDDELEIRIYDTSGAGWNSLVSHHYHFPRFEAEKIDVEELSVPEKRRLCWMMRSLEG